MFDIGVNLTSSQFAKDRRAVVERARVAGVTGMLITGTDLAESREAAELAQQHAGYGWSTAGVHPHYASGWDEHTAEQIYALAACPEVAAIGECGPDFNRNFSTPAQQEAAFTAQLALAAELALPVFLHCRDAHARFAELLTPWLDKLPAAVVHCFTGTAEELTSCLSLGLSIGITGWVCDERRGPNCAPCCRRSRPSVCCWKRTPLICCPGIYNLNPHLAATNPVSCPISCIRSPSGDRKSRNGWGKNR